MNRTDAPRPYSTRLATALVLILLAGVSPLPTGAAQDRPDPDPGRATRPPNEGRAGFPGPTMTTLDDAPDFAPMRRIDAGAGASADDANAEYELTGSPYVLSFIGGDYTPPRGVDPRMERAASLDPAGETFGYVMVRGRLNDPVKRAALERVGLTLYEAHPWQTVAARIPFTSLGALKALPFVHWVGYAQPEQKVHPALMKALDDPAATNRHRIHVTTFASDVSDASTRTISPRESTNDPRAVAGQTSALVPNGTYQKGLEALGFRFDYYSEIMNVHVFEGTATRDEILRIRDLDYVAFVELRQKDEAAHDQSQLMVSLDRVRKLYDGSKITCGVIDSGIDSTPWHDDFRNKSFVGWSTVGGNNNQAFQDGAGHGTHVSGTIFGDGNADARYEGGLPKAGTAGEGNRIFIGRYLDAAGRGQGNIATLYGALAADFVNNNTTNKRPRVINNSWGAEPGTTQWVGSESLARLTDPYVFNGQLHVFAAGNRGVGVWSPGSAKNVLTVGSVDDRGSNTGRTSSFSRDGVADGRRKPEVSAPGNTVTSCAKDSTTSYASFLGTSMAAPHVTAALSGLVQHLSFFDYRPAPLQACAIATSEVQGNKTFDPRQGWGLINAYKQHYTSKTSWFVGWNDTAIARSGQWTYWDVAIPSNAVMVAPVLVWLEASASPGAPRARLNDVRLYLDSTRNSVGNSGQYSLSSAVDNKLWGTISGSTLNQFKGRTVRVKAFGQSVGGLCKVGLCLLYQFRDTRTPAPTLSVSANTTMVRPGLTVTMTGRWNASATGDEFDNATMYPSVFPFRVTQLMRTTADGITQTYTDTSHPSSPFPSLGSNGIVGGQGTSRSAVWNIQAPTTSSLYTVRLFGRADTATGTQSAPLTICVDGIGPNTPITAASTTHTVSTWTSNRNFTAGWTAPSDRGCAGLLGYGLRYNLNGCATASSMNAGLVTTSSTTFPSTSGSRWFFDIQAYDRLGNVSTNVCRGPYLIDTVAPTSPTMQIASGAAVTRSLLVTLTGLGATEPTNGSGVAEMRFSNDGTTWSPWEGFATTRSGWDLSRFGGNANGGTKRVYAQFRDRARNASSSVTDTITYDAIDISSVSPNRGTLIGGDTITISGAGFVNGQTQVRFDGVLATAVNVTSSTGLTCVTPTNLTWKKVDVRVAVGNASDTLTNGYEYVGADVRATGNPRVGIPFPVTFNAPVDGNRFYSGVASFGQGPIPLAPHGALRLSPDDLFFLTAENKIPMIFAGIQGTTNANGQGVCQVTIPNLPGAIGLRFHMGFVTTDASKPLGIRTVSTTKTLQVQP